jgi:hypothetical protein
MSLATGESTSPGRECKDVHLTFPPYGATLTFLLGALFAAWRYSDYGRDFHFVRAGEVNTQFYDG